MKDTYKTAFKNLIILEIGDYVSAPYCTKLFADYGANVIKIEPKEGDSSRKSAPFPNDIPNSETSGLYLNLNTNKNSCYTSLPLHSKLPLDIYGRSDFLCRLA